MTPRRRVPWGRRVPPNPPVASAAATAARTAAAAAAESAGEATAGNTASGATAAAGTTGTATSAARATASAHCAAGAVTARTVHAHQAAIHPVHAVGAAAHAVHAAAGTAEPIVLLGHVQAAADAAAHQQGRVGAIAQIGHLAGRQSAVLRRCRAIARRIHVDSLEAAGLEQRGPSVGAVLAASALRAACAVRLLAAGCAAVGRRFRRRCRGSRFRGLHSFGRFGGCRRGGRRPELPVRKAAGAGAAAAAVMALIDRNLRFHSGEGASKAIPTSFESLAKPSISTSMVHEPSARSANEYRPFSSLVVKSFLSPLVAVTDAPGTGSPPDLITPWCSAAIRPATATQTARRRPR